MLSYPMPLHLGIALVIALACRSTMYKAVLKIRRLDCQNQDPVLQPVWHDKDPSLLLKQHNCRSLNFAGWWVICWQSSLLKKYHKRSSLKSMMVNITISRRMHVTKLHCNWILLCYNPYTSYCPGFSQRSVNVV